MIHSTSMLACVLALVCATPVHTVAAGDSAIPVIFRVSDVKRDGLKVVRIGTPESSVRHHLGNPHRTLSDHVWIYYNYRGSSATAVEHDCRTLIITLDNDRVTNIALANTRATAVIAANMKKDPTFLTRTLVAME